MTPVEVAGSFKIPPRIIPTQEGDYKLKAEHDAVEAAIQGLFRLGVSTRVYTPYRPHPELARVYIYGLPSALWCKIGLGLHNPGHAVMVGQALGELRKRGIEFHTMGKHRGAVRVWFLDWSFHVRA